MVKSKLSTLVCKHAASFHETKPQSTSLGIDLLIVSSFIIITVTATSTLTASNRQADTMGTLMYHLDVWTHLLQHFSLSTSPHSPRFSIFIRLFHRRNKKYYPGWTNDREMRTLPSSRHHWNRSEQVNGELLSRGGAFSEDRFCTGGPA